MLRRARPAETPHRASSSTHHSQCVGNLYADQWIVVGAMPLLLQIHSRRCKRLYVGPEDVMRLVGRVLGRQVRLSHLYAQRTKRTMIHTSVDEAILSCRPFRPADEQIGGSSKCRVKDAVIGA